jgi:hypothetical protein
MKRTSTIRRQSQELLSQHGFRFNRRFRSGIELWKGPVDLYLDPPDAPQTLPQLLRACWEMGLCVGTDAERLRVSKEFKIPLDELIFGKDNGHFSQ